MVTIPSDVHFGATAGVSRTPEAERARPYVLPRVEGMNELIVLLAMAAQLFFAIPALKLLQSGAEVILFLLLIYACATIRFGLRELGLLALLVAMAAISMAINNVAVVLVGMKQFGLAILTLIYFSRVRFRSRLILPAFVVSVMLMAISRVAPSVVAPLVRISWAPEFNESRFGGLFLNTHYNAYFLAVALIYYGYRVHLAGLGQVIIFVTGSKFVYVSYAANVAARFRVLQLIGRYKRFVACVIIAAIIAVWVHRAEIVASLGRSDMISLYVIISQLFDPQFYRLVLNPFPGDYLAIVSGVRESYGAASYTNEIALFAMSVQGGVFLTIAYLAALLKETRYYRIFIIVSLFHYGFVLSPLIVYMLVTYSREIALLRGDGEPEGDNPDARPTVNAAHVMVPDAG